MNLRTNHLTDRDLLGAIDGDLTGQRRRAVDAHLSHCQDCSSRRAHIETAAASATDLYQAAYAAATDASRARERLQAAMIREQQQQVAGWKPATAPWIGAAVALAAIVLLVVWLQPARTDRLALSLAHLDDESDALPVAALTPGVTWNVGVTELCSSAARELRPIQADVRREVLKAYGMEGLPADQYELDYLITPELGGAPDARNLWPQRYRSRVWNAYVKDQLEQLLPKKVCRGEIDLVTAQREIAGDWVAAYRKHFETSLPIQLRAHLSDAGETDEDEVMYPVWRAAGGPALKLVAFSAQR